jgi:non-ribosomal peptide synthetase component E (peptide arylation enzyme)
MGGNGAATCTAGVGGGFLTRSHQFQQQHFFGTAFYQPGDIIDRLQEKLIMVQDEADTQRNRADELKKLCQENKKQIASLREQLEAKEAKFGDMIKDEVFQWEQAVS